MSKRRFLTLLLMLFAVSSLLVGCGGPKTYVIEKSALYGNGVLLNGPDDAVTPEECYLSVENDQIEFHYFSYTYHGESYSGFLYWDSDPLLVADATYSLTQFSETSNGYHMTIWYDYPLDDETAVLQQEFWFTK